MESLHFPLLSSLPELLLLMTMIVEFCSSFYSVLKNHCLILAFDYRIPRALQRFSQECLEIWRAGNTKAHGMDLGIVGVKTV